MVKQYLSLRVFPFLYTYMLISNMIKTLLYEKVVPLWDKLVSQELFSLKRKKKMTHLNHRLSEVFEVQQPLEKENVLQYRICTWCLQFPMVTRWQLIETKYVSSHQPYNFIMVIKITMWFFGHFWSISI